MDFIRRSLVRQPRKTMPKRAVASRWVANRVSSTNSKAA